MMSSKKKQKDNPDIEEREEVIVNKFKTNAKIDNGVFVTDFKWLDTRISSAQVLPQVATDEKGFTYNRIGYYMNDMLALNMASIPKYLSKSWDVVGIVSGHGKVRIGKSTIAQQTGYYIAWLLAGGEMEFYYYKDNPERVFARVKKHPDKKVNFDLDNIVFRPGELIKTARALYEKHGRSQVIIYDEGRLGLESARSMEQVNKMMQNFFQECGFMGHVILIVLPNFFKLHEDYAVNRSLFLIDVYADQKLNRGYFSFYNEQQKEWLFYIGKKRIGSSLKYVGINPSFKGRFSQFIPLDKKEYEKKKLAALQSDDDIPKQYINKVNRLRLISQVLRDHHGLSCEDIVTLIKSRYKKDISFFNMDASWIGEEEISLSKYLDGFGLNMIKTKRK